MADMEEKSTEVIWVTHHKMDDTEDNSSEIACDMRKPRCMKAEMKNVQAEAYYCLAREREKAKHEYNLRKNANQIRQ